MERDAHIEAHYRANYERLVRSIGHRVGYTNSEDAVQEAYARALKYWPAFDQAVGTFNQWFTSILNNATKDVIHSNVRTGVESVNDHANNMGRSGGSWYRVELSAIAEALAAEPEPRRTAIKLALVDGYLYAEVAELSPLSAKNVEKVINRFRKKL